MLLAFGCHNWVMVMACLIDCEANLLCSAKWAVSYDGVVDVRLGVYVNC